MVSPGKGCNSNFTIKTWTALLVYNFGDKNHDEHLTFSGSSGIIVGVDFVVCSLLDTCGYLVRIYY